MTIDATAGPPWRPPSAPAIDQNYAEQAGGVDASSRDEHNFVDGTAPLYARVLVEHYNAQVAQSRIGEAEDREMADDHVANAEASLVESVSGCADLQTNIEHEREAQAKLIEQVDGHGGLHRRNERPRVTVLWLVLVPVIALGVEVPWSYFALRVLGEGTYATMSMAVLFGFLGALLAELCGVTLRELRVASRSSRRGWATLAASAGLVLAVVAWFLATLRTAYLAAPMATSQGTVMPSGLERFHLSGQLVTVGWLAVNFGLYLGVASLTYLHFVPGLRGLQRADRTLADLERRLPGATRTVVVAAERVRLAKIRLEDVPAKWQAHRDVLHAEMWSAIDWWYLGNIRKKNDPAYTTAAEHHVPFPGIDRAPSMTEEKDDDFKNKEDSKKPPDRGSIRRLPPPKPKDGEAPAKPGPPA